MPTTVSDLIHSSFRLIGAIAAGEILETAELNDALVSLNQMIASWNTEGLSLAGRLRQLIPVGPGSQTYPLDLRPIKIDAGNVAISSINAPLEIVDAAGWSSITEHGSLAIMVKKLFCDYIYPNSTVYLWPIPRTSGLLELWIYAPIALFSSLSQIIDLPPGYEMALRYNFAIALVPEYPRSQVDPTLPAQAQNYKASLVQLNASNHHITQQPAAQIVAAQGVS